MSKKSKDTGKAPKGQKKPKKKCCTSTPRCKRCPLRMLAEGTLPAGYAVRHRKLIKPAKVAKLTEVAEVAEPTKLAVAVVAERNGVETGKAVRKAKKRKRNKKGAAKAVKAKGAKDLVNAHGKAERADVRRAA